LNALTKSNPLRGTDAGTVVAEITNDSAKYQKTAKAHSEVAGIVEKYREYKDLKRGISESRAVLVDEKIPRCEPTPKKNWRSSTHGSSPLKRS